MPKSIMKFSNGRMSFDYTEANRQGELLFFKIVPGTLKTFYGRSLKVKSGVIREGEKAGHEHKITGKEVQLTMFPESATPAPGETGEQPSTGIIEIKENGAKVTHPEHGALPLKKGKHVVLTQKESAGKNKTISVKD